MDNKRNPIRRRCTVKAVRLFSIPLNERYAYTFLVDVFDIFDRHKILFKAIVL